PVLLGLSSLVDLPDRLDQYMQEPTIVNNTASIQFYQDTFSVYSLKYSTHTAQDALADIERWISRIQSDLYEIHPQQKTDLLTVLWNFHALSAKIYGEDLCNWVLAFEHLNDALEIANTTNNSDMLASSLYRSIAIARSIEPSSTLDL
ncbi:MAG: hypothetical protein ACRDHW_13160, partial [Ktedonobacteraceae bacterium]